MLDRSAAMPDAGVFSCAGTRDPTADWRSRSRNRRSASELVQNSTYALHLTMKTTVHHAIAALFATAALCGSDLSAQDVLLNEVRADTGGRWIELHNRSAGTIDISSWSLHVASRTLGTPQNYWWAFPAGTTITGGGFLRVHWFQAAPASAMPNELYTGDTVWDFLFGLGGETLRADRGALGLFRSQLDTMMDTPSVVEDWVSWGDHDFSREQLAVANGRWTNGHQAPAIAAGTSLARDVTLFGLGLAHDELWFVDHTPTPLAPNQTGATVTSYGASCAVNGNHLLGEPLLRATSQPLLGNPQFGIALDRTTGIYGEYVLVAWSAGAAPAGQPSVLPPANGGCAESIDTSQLLALWLLPTQVMTTGMPLSLATMPAGLVGSELHAQALVIDLLPSAYPPYQGLSNALRIVFGQ